MLWIFALGIVGICIVSSGFRKVLAWAAGGILVAYVIVALFVHVQEGQQAAAEKSSAEASRIAWFKAHPQGCAPFEKIGERGTAVLESEGNCGWDLPLKD